MTARRPLVRVGGRDQQLPAGDKLDVPAEWDALKAPAIAAGALVIDLATPAGFRVALNQNVTTLSFANVPAGRVVVFTITWVQDATGGRTVAFPASVKADGGGAPVQPTAGANAVTVQSFYTDDGGVTVWQASSAPADLYRRSNILGTVSQSGGVPTGAIIERGSNANGEYVRFADGTQICTLTMAPFLVSPTIPQGSSYNTPLVAFPAAFVGAPLCLSSASLGADATNSTATYMGSSELNGITGWRASFYILGGAPLGRLVRVHLAIGRWY